MTTTKVAIFPGSFDPITRGHVDIVKRSVCIFERVIIAVLSNTQKSTLFTLDERVHLIREEFKEISDNVEVQSFSGLLVDFARENKARIVIRGLRAISDFDYEAQMAIMNKNLYEDLETFFLIAREVNSYVSSSLVRNIAALGGDVSKLVTPLVEKALLLKLKR